MKGGGDSRRKKRNEGGGREGGGDRGLRRKLTMVRKDPQGRERAGPK